MRNYMPQPLNAQHLEDAITCLNLVYPGRTFYVSKKWYQKALEHGLIDDCCFNVVVSNRMFNPLNSPIIMRRRRRSRRGFRRKKGYRIARGGFMLT